MHKFFAIINSHIFVADIVDILLKFIKTCLAANQAGNRLNYQRTHYLVLGFIINGVDFIFHEILIIIFDILRHILRILEFFLMINRTHDRSQIFAVVIVILSWRFFYFYICIYIYICICICICICIYKIFIVNLSNFWSVVSVISVISIIIVVIHFYAHLSP